MSSENDNLADTVDLLVPKANSPRQEKWPSSHQVHVELGALSHRGHVRPNNEDCYLVSRFGRSLHTMFTNLPEDIALAHTQEVGYCMVVADGMGGPAAGEVASRSAITSLVQLIRETPDWILSGDDRMTEAVMRRMAERFRQIDDDLIQQASSNAAFAGMGTTMTLVCTLGLDGIVCHIGDSRAYCFRQGQLRQLTRDMSIAQHLVDQGILSQSEAATNRLRHVLTQCLGGGHVKAEVLRLHLEDNDRLLLCSDGLTEMVSDAKLAEILGKGGTPAQATKRLVDQALSAGGKDNITAVLAEFCVGPSA